MKFILLIEEDGYQVNYWDQITDSIGVSIASNWDVNKLYSTLLSKGFNIEKNTLIECINKIENENKQFVVLKSRQNAIDLDTFINDLFEIDDV